MKLTPLIEQVRNWCPTFAGRVAGALDWDPVAAASVKMVVPFAVIVMTEDAAEPSDANVIRQAITDDFDVCVTVAQSDERGQLAADVVHDIRAELWRALAGFVPGPEYEPIEYLGGSLLAINRDRVVYRFGFTAGFQLGRNQASDPPETWEEREQDGLPDLRLVHVAMDAIDPMADPNLNYPGPDGRIEVEQHINLEQSP